MKFKNEDILKDKEFKVFLMSRKLKPGSEKRYTERIKGYCNFHQMSMTELIKEAEDEQDSGEKLRHRHINFRLNDFVNHLEFERYLLPETIHGYISSVKAVYNNADIILPKNISLPKKDNSKVFDETLKFEEIKAVITSATQREKAIFTTSLSSGMAANEIRHLTYGHFLRGLERYTKTDEFISVPELSKILKKFDNEKIIPFWWVRRIKTEYDYVAFSSTESVREIILYLLERENGRFPVRSKEDILFATQTTGGMISSRAFADLYERSNRKHNLGLDEKNGYGKFTSHAMRRFFGTSIIYTNIQQLKADFLLGHAIDPVKAAYFKNDPERLLPDYEKVLPELTLDRIVTTEDPNVKKVVKQLEERDRQIEEMNLQSEKRERQIKETELLNQKLLQYIKGKKDYNDIISEKLPKHE